MEGQTSQYAYKKIALKPDTFQRLRSLGRYGETADDIVNKIMHAAEAGKVVKAYE